MEYLERGRSEVQRESYGMVTKESRTRQAAPILQVLRGLTTQERAVTHDLNLSRWSCAGCRILTQKCTDASGNPKGMTFAEARSHSSATMSV